MAETCNGCPFYERYVVSGYSYSDVSHRCWEAPGAPIVRKVADRDERHGYAPPACSKKPKGADR